MDIKFMPKKIHILYADDDNLMRQLVGGKLSKKGFEIIYATDGNEARDMARRFQPELIMLDYRMPIFDGLTTAKYLKSEEPTKHLPVILLTNEDISVEGQKMWSELGLDGYIHKSADFQDFYDKIIEVLKKYKYEIPEEDNQKDPLI
jgi:DNA-binding response OmpR family regulator